MPRQPTGQPAGPSRRSLLMAAGGAGAALGLSGCMRGLTPQTPESSGLQMMFWGEGDQNTKLLDAIKGWEDSDAGSHVNTQYMPLNGYFDKLATRLAGGSPPDLFQIFLPYLSDYLDRDAVLPLDDYAQDLGLHTLPDSIMPTVRIKGHYCFAVVGAATQPAVQYNADKLKTLGLRPASDDWTLDDFQDTMLEVYETSKGALHGVADMGGAQVQIESYMRAIGTPLFTASGQLAFSKDEFGQWLRLWDKLRKNGACPPISVTVEATSFQNDPLVLGKAAYTATATSRGYPSIQSLTKDRLGLLQFPRGTADSAPGTNIIPAGWFAISRRSRHVEQSVSLLKHLFTDPDAARAMGMARGVPLAPVQRDALTNLPAQQQEVLDNYEQVAKQKDIAPLQLYPAGASELLTTSLLMANQSVGTGRAGITQATDQFFTDAARILK